MAIAAIYARVSSDKQREENTIASQTSALIDFARSRGYQVPTDWVFEDEGYSGASLVRPGLERVRDLAAEGQIEAVLVHAPDRLSRRYAYQILLIEELARHGVETVFIRAPQAATAEDQLLVQFQGMIAEYERAQILERSRRGKRHRARQGQINVLSGAPYGYRYVRKSDNGAARYEIIDVEADIVRMVYDHYIVDGMSIGAITRLLNERGVPTRKQISRWERSTVWAMLRNPAYKGTACFGKTETASRQRITRPLRLRGGVGSRDSAHRERPRADWIEITVPAIVEDDIFARARELLEQNKKLAPRRTIEPSIVQGLVFCSKCGYALSRTSTRSSARNIHYYRCLGSDAWRRLGGPVCDNRPIRQDLLDQVVWTEVVRLLEDPSLIQNELDRRLAVAQTADPAKQREKVLQRDLARHRKGMDRLLTAYQEDLLSLDELRRRMPELRQRERALQAELQSILDQVNDRAVYLRLAETLSGFLGRLRTSAGTLDIQERQRIVRLLVKEILIGEENIVIRHSIPLSSTPPTASDPQSPPSGPGAPIDKNYLLRSGRHDTALWNALLARRFQHDLQKMQDIRVLDPLRHFCQQPVVPDIVEIGSQVEVEHARLPLDNGLSDSLDRVMSCPFGPIAKRAWLEIRFEDRFEYELERALHHPVPDRRYRKDADFAAILRYLLPPGREWPVGVPSQFVP
jgi:site-specific DNA recombinase